MGTGYSAGSVSPPIHQSAAVLRTATCLTSPLPLSILPSSPRIGNREYEVHVVLPHTPTKNIASGPKSGKRKNKRAYALFCGFWPPHNRARSGGVRDLL